MLISNSKKNVFYAFLFQFLSLVIGFFLRKLLLNNVNLLLIGINNVYENIIAMISLLNFGIGSASIYYLYKFFSKNDKEKSMLYYHAFVKLFRYVAIGVFILGLLFLFIIDLVVDTSNINPIYVRVFFFIHLIKAILSFLITCPRYALQCDEKRYYNLKADIACIVLFGVIKAISIVYTKSYIVYILLSVLEMVVSNTYIYLCFKSQYNHTITFSKQELSQATKEITTYSKKLAIGDINHFVNNCTDNILLSKICGNLSVALLSNYYLIVDSIKAFITQIFSSIEATAIKKLNLTSQEKDYCIIYRTTTIIAYIIASFSSLFLFTLTDCFISLVFGSNFAIGIDIPILMVLNLIVIIFQYPSAYLINSKGLQNKTVIFSSFMMISNISLSIIFGLIIGEKGILAATIIANSILMFGQDYVVAKYIILKNKKIFIMKYLFIILIFIELLFSMLFIPKVYTISSFIYIIFITVIICIISIIPFLLKNKNIVLDFFN